jgi:ATP-binding cassette subfamily F protein uup
VRQLEKLRLERAARRERQGNVKLSLDAGERSGKLVAELDNVIKAYGDRTLIKGFTTRIMRGDRIGLLGPNGIGKTTLLKLILGEEEADSGIIRRGTNMNVAYFDQMREQLDEEATLADTISPGSDFVEIGNERKHVISYLEDFLFPPQRSRSPVKSLSGGERNRLLLARLFSRPSNVLVLDEPTNDLDIDTLELLESLLQDFPGTLFLVSHDRAFLENTVTQVIAFEGNGQLTEFGGGYDDWLRFTEQRASAISNTPKAKAPEQKPATESAKPAKAKLSYKEQLELAKLPEKIEKIETEITAINMKLADPEIYKTDLDKATALQIELTELDKALLNIIARWEELESKNAV